MSSQIERLENSVVKLTIDVSADRLKEGLDYSFNKNKGAISLPGFRKGKVPRALVEKQYGDGFLLDDAINYIFPEAYSASVKEHGVSPVSRPELDMSDYDKEKGMTLIVTVTVKPEVTLGEYKGLTYNDYDASVTDSDIEEEINKDREKNARMVSITDRPIQTDDTAVIDFEGFVDGFAFEGGKGTDYELVIGSHTFIDTFEDQLIGKNVGDDVDVNVTFPENYGKEDLAGRAAVFKVEVKDIQVKELPDVDDEFAKDVSEFDTLDEYKNSIKEMINEQKAEKKEHDMEDELIKKISDNATVEVPAVMVNNQVDQMLADFDNRMKVQGLGLEMFLKYTGQTYEQFRESYMESAAHSVRARLVLEQIAKVENIVISEEEIDAEIARVSETYGVELEKMKEIMREEDLKGLETDLKTQKALKVVTESAVGEKSE